MPKWQKGINIELKIECTKIAEYSANYLFILANEIKNHKKRGCHFWNGKKAVQITVFKAKFYFKWNARL